MVFRAVLNLKTGLFFTSGQLGQLLYKKTI